MPQLGRWIKSGAQHISLRFAGGDQLAQVDEVASPRAAEAQVATVTCPAFGALINQRVLMRRFVLPNVA